MLFFVRQYYIHLLGGSLWTPYFRRSSSRSGGCKSTSRSPTRRVSACGKPDRSGLCLPQRPPKESADVNRQPVRLPANATGLFFGVGRLLGVNWDPCYWTGSRVTLAVSFEKGTLHILPGVIEVVGRRNLAVNGGQRLSSWPGRPCGNFDQKPNSDR